MEILGLKKLTQWINSLSYEQLIYLLENINIPLGDDYEL